jgi:hypothetical protein
MEVEEGKLEAGDDDPPADHDEGVRAQALGRGAVGLAARRTLQLYVRTDTQGVY